MAKILSVSRCLILLCLICYVNCENRPRFKPTWDSLDSRSLPRWYDEAKVGIFIHWGVYSVPTIGTEWFWTNWRDAKTPSYVDYMTKNFKPGFTYQEFAPQFTAEHFDANEWAKLFEQSGARYRCHPYCVKANTFKYIFGLL